MSVFTLLYRSVCMFVLLAGLTVTATAQSVTGSLYGTVTDSTGAAIPGATITLTNVETNIKTTGKTNASGNFLFPVVERGRYKATAVMSGFTTTTQEGLIVDANQNVNASFKLGAGEVAEVTIEASAPAVDTREHQIATTIDQKAIQDLPLAGRNPYDLVQLVPGITNYAAADLVGDLNGTQFSSNGMRTNMNSFYLDGAFNTSYYRGGGNLTPNPDALSQFRIITSNFDAEFGRYPGSVVNVITRSGNNVIHGSAYDFIRNTIGNAKNYFQSRVTPYHYNVFGGGVGGPVIKDKFFLYGSYQGLRFNTYDVRNVGDITVPTTAERALDFSNSTVKPTKGLVTGVNNCGTPTAPKLCPGAVNSTSALLLPLIPQPSGPTSRLNAEFSAVLPRRADQGTLRGDYRLNTTHSISGTFFQSRGSVYQWNAGANSLYSYSGSVNRSNQSNYILADTWTVSPNLVNTTTAFYSLNRTVRENAVKGFFLPDIGLQYPYGQNPSVYTQAQWTVQGYFTAGVGSGGPINQSQLVYGISDTANLNAGNHQIKFGGGANLNRYDETGAFNGSGVITFASGTNSVSGNPFWDFLTGKPFTQNQNSGSFLRTHAWDPSAFVQDNWRISRRLTLNLGVRWEVYYPFSGSNDQGTFDYNRQSVRFPTAPRGLLSSGDPGVPDGILVASYIKFAPRVGFAMDVFGDGKTAIRGGLGFFYATSQETFIGNLKQQPFTLAVNLTTPQNWQNPYVATTSPVNTYTTSPFPLVFDPANPKFQPLTTATTFTGLKPGSSTVPYSQQFSLTLEQQLTNDWSTRIGYVGSAGRHFYIVRDQNAPVYLPSCATSAPASTCNTTAASIIARRPLGPQGYGSIILLDPSSNSSYNSLQVSLTRRLKRKASFTATYVWSKAIDTTSADTGTAQAQVITDSYNLQADRAVSSLHQPNRFVANGIYQTPDVRFAGLIGKQLLSGWQVNGILTLASGQPFNITAGTDVNLNGNNNDRPLLAGVPYLPTDRAKTDKIKSFFNTAAFVVPTSALQQAIPRNYLLGPGFVNADVSIFKRFPVFREATFLYRFEMFNAFNNTNLGQPNGTRGAANFGTITDTRLGTSNTGARVLQMAAKIEF